MTVYFAQQDNAGAIKIGRPPNLDGRMAALQTSAPARINLLAKIDGDKKTESYFHHRLAEYRCFGEWFHPHQEVIELIDRVKAVGVAVVPAEFRPRHQPMARTARDTSDIIAEAKNWIEELAHPVPLGEGMVATLKRVATTAGVSARALKSIWYDETRQLNAHVYVGLMECFNAKMALALAPELRG